MKKTFILTVFLSSLVLMIISFGVSSYSIKRIIQDDPTIDEKIQAAMTKRYDLKNFHISLPTDDGADSGTYTKANDSWKFENQTDKIKIRLYSGEVEFLSHDEESFLIKAQGYLNEGKSKKLLEVSFNDKQLFIKEFDEHRTRDIKLKVFLPKSFNKKVEITNISGEVLIRKISARQIDIDSISGDIVADEPVAKDLLLKTVSGEIKLTLIPNEGPYNFKITTISGDVKNSIKDSSEKGKLVSIQTVSGDVEID